MVDVDCGARRWATMRHWLTVQEAASLWGVKRRAAMERALARRVRVQRAGDLQTSAWRLAACCVSAEAKADVCDCRTVLSAVEARKCAQ